MKTTPDYERQARLLKALADPTRLRIVRLLEGREEASGTEIAGLVGVSMAMLCHHWTILSDAGLITKRREGQTIYGSLNRPALQQCVKGLLGEE